MLINQRHAEFALSLDPKPVQPADTLLLFRGQEVLLRTAADVSRLPLWADVSPAFASATPLHAFTQGDRRFFIADAAPDASTPPGFSFEGVRAFRTLQPAQDAALLSAAYHLSVWYNQHHFCGACGGGLHPAPAERALRCESCGLTIYPSVLPAVIVAVTDGDRLLLARNAHGPFRKFSLLAGYVEIGETAEQAVRREVLEEVGLAVKNIRYVKSQSWGYSQSLMLAFIAQADSRAAITLQESELSEARWFARAEVPAYESTASIAIDLIDQFRRGLIGAQP